MKETETHKAIEQEAEQVYPYPNRDFCLDRKDYEQSCALVDLKRIVWTAGRSKSLEEKEKEIERLKGLIEKMYFYRHNHQFNPTKSSQVNDILYRKFKTENQL